YIQDNMHLGELVSVMVYLDSEERPIATTETPKAYINEFALLKLVDINTHGGFLDWGLTKQLFIPHAEMYERPSVGAMLFVYIYLDPLSSRILASSKIEKFLDDNCEGLAIDQEVDIIPFAKTPMGYKCVINFTCVGMIYENEIFQIINIGTSYKAYVKKVREDKKIDLILQKVGAKKLPEITEVLYELIQSNPKVAQLNDNSPPELIYSLTGMSKKNYKKALGMLYKSGKVVKKT
ncbi:MAG TPA: S1-like domain-containing RNA-binding protein, partial [Saprospiraceae bacterium]|nr:S1-like domain-containing RNA-binding protein [Saprospiraceae bacterium]